jgi:hypothetical protein
VARRLSLPEIGPLSDLGEMPAYTLQRAVLLVVQLQRPRCNCVLFLLGVHQTLQTWRLGLFTFTRS